MILNINPEMPDVTIALFKKYDDVMHISREEFNKEAYDYSIDRSDMQYWDTPKWQATVDKAYARACEWVPAGYHNYSWGEAIENISTEYRMWHSKKYTPEELEIVKTENRRKNRAFDKKRILEYYEKDKPKFVAAVMESGYDAEAFVERIKNGDDSMSDVELGEVFYAGVLGKNISTKKAYKPQ